MRDRSIDHRTLRSRTLVRDKLETEAGFMLHVARDKRSRVRWKSEALSRHHTRNDTEATDESCNDREPRDTGDIWHVSANKSVCRGKRHAKRACMCVSETVVCARKLAWISTLADYGVTIIDVK